MSVTLRLFLFVFATYVLCLHDAGAQFSYSGSEELPQITMAVVVDTSFVSMSSKHMSMSVQNYLLLAKRNHLKHVDLRVLSYSTTNADIDKDVTAVVSVSPCFGAWQLHQSLQDHAVLHLAVTEVDCPRLPLDESITAPLVNGGEELSQLVLDLKTSGAVVWDKVNVFYDESVDSYSIQRLLSDLNSALPGGRVGPSAVSIFKILGMNKQPDFIRRKQIVHLLKDYPVESLGHNFLVIVSYYLVGVIMEVARSVGLVHPGTQWLYVIADTDGIKDNVTWLGSQLEEGENVAFLYNVTSKEPNCMDGVKCHLEELLVSFARALEKTIEKEIILSSQVAEEEWEVIRPSKADRRSTLLDLIKRDLLVSGRCGNCTCWRLKAGDTWTVGAQSLGQDLLHVGWWRPRSGLQLTDHVFPNLRFGFRGRTLNLISFHYPPWQIFSYNESGHVHYSGVVFEIINQLAERLNFSYHIVLASNNQDGLSNVTRPDLKETLGMNPDLSLINIPWENIVTAVQQKKVFLAAGAFTVTDKRKKQVNFTRPVGIQAFSFLVSRPHELSRALLFMYPFTSQTWLCIAVTLAAMGPLLRFFHRSSPYYDYHHKRGPSGLSTMANCVWYVYGALLQQGGRYLPEADSGRIIVGTWWLVVLVIVTTYCGNLVAFLTFPKFEATVRTLEDLQGGRVTWGALVGSAIVEHFTLSDNPRHRWLLPGLIRHPELTPEVINHVRWGQHVYMEWKINLQYLMKREFLATNSCDFALAEVDFLEERLAMVMAMNSPYLVVINEELRRMHQTGLIQKWLLDHLPGKDRCSISGKISEANTHTVNLNDMQGSFFVLFLGFLFSGLLIAIECCYHKSKLSKERRVIKPFIT